MKIRTYLTKLNFIEDTLPFTLGMIQGDSPWFGMDCLASQGKYFVKDT